jgi:hypothetical protein
MRSRMGRGPENLSRRDCGALIGLELMFLMTVIILELVIPLRTAENRSRAADISRKIATAALSFALAQGRPPASLDDLSGFLDEELLAGVMDGYLFQVQAAAPGKVRIAGRPAAPGLTGDVDLTLEVDHWTGVIGEPGWTPSPGADAARNAMLTEVQAVTVRVMEDLLRNDPTAPKGAELMQHLCDPVTIASAFAELDEDGDGRVSPDEILSPRLRAVEDLEPFLAQMLPLLQFGAGNEDTATLPGAALENGLTECSLPLFPPFHRGDANGDASADISDAVAIFGFLFLGGAAPGCLEAANSNDDATLDISDGIYLLSFLFTGGPAPLPPGPPSGDCGEDPPGVYSTLGCLVYDSC